MQHKQERSTVLHSAGPCCCLNVDMVSVAPQLPECITLSKILIIVSDLRLPVVHHVVGGVLAPPDILLKFCFPHNTLVFGAAASFLA